ncbi:SOS response-associated peptidase [Anaerocolumna xylanovorans]|uniref:Abasic site processing protein n=1 Tax=Anaerocolumna xylanovorans DSM 12503 TaxID=1121345 RepID=A0A1M7Y943_9FIRM|nr:SOS response-associated peptidase family protein [Anaerocolumna xylanovorans]SHO49155.1 Putative SOS response-associated peptidase YedK [Anaerocolumna xylanovorans DSM 12503]
MCSRYYINEESVRELKKLVNETDQAFGQKEYIRDIRPSEPALVLIAKENKLHSQEKLWGFPGLKGKGLIINARSETALTKNIFRDSILTRRCVIPAAGFYEWNSLKEKASFYSADSPVLYMAGCYSHFNDADCFVILTAPANESMIGTHDRMPLLIEEKEILPWLLDSARTEEFLLKKPHELKKDMAYEQISFPLS